MSLSRNVSGRLLDPDSEALVKAALELAVIGSFLLVGGCPLSMPWSLGWG